MARGRRLFVAMTGFLLSGLMVLQTGVTAQAGNNKNYLDSFNGGITAVLDLGTIKATGTRKTVVTNMEASEEETEYDRVMANVQYELNVRSEASEKSERVGILYKDCGGTILDRKDGWTLLQSGNVIGWAKDEYLLFGEEAETLANEVGKLIAHMDDTLRIRKAPDKDAEVYGVLPKGDIAEVLSVEENGWICIDYEGNDGYVMEAYVTLDFLIDTAQTMEEVEARKKEEAEAKRHIQYGEYATDEDTLTLLAALIQCEAGGESYEGQVAVGAVVMNRVRSTAYPNTISGVIYASGQFTPAMTGKLDRLLASGNIYESCYKAAKEALSGVSNVGDLTHFRRVNGREGLVIGNHVFY